jgi:hypothetical protein
MEARTEASGPGGRTGAPAPHNRRTAPIPRMRIEINRERQAVELILEPRVAVRKSAMRLDSIQDSLDSHLFRCLREVMVGSCTGRCLRVDTGMGH